MMSSIPDKAKTHSKRYVETLLRWLIEECKSVLQNTDGLKKVL